MKNLKDMDNQELTQELVTLLAEKMSLKGISKENEKRFYEVREELTIRGIKPTLFDEDSKE